MPEEVNWPTPAHQVNAAMHDARQGQMPTFTPAELLTNLRFGEEPTDLPFLDRFAGNGSRVSREILVLQGYVAELIELANAHEANEAQEALAHMVMGDALAAQIESGGEICLAARSLILVIERDDIIPLEVRLSFGAGDAAKMKLAKERAARLKGFLMFLAAPEEE